MLPSSRNPEMALRGMQARKHSPAAAGQTVGTWRRGARSGPDGGQKMPEKSRGAPRGAPRTCVTARTYIAGIIGAAVFLRRALRRPFLRPAFLRVPFLRPPFLRRVPFLRVPFLRPAFFRPAFLRPARFFLAGIVPYHLSLNEDRRSSRPRLDPVAATSRAHGAHCSPAEEQPMEDREREHEGNASSQLRRIGGVKKWRQQKIDGWHVFSASPGPRTSLTCVSTCISASYYSVSKRRCRPHARAADIKKRALQRVRAARARLRTPLCSSQRFVCPTAPHRIVGAAVDNHKARNELCRRHGGAPSLLRCR